MEIIAIPPMTPPAMAPACPPECESVAAALAEGTPDKFAPGPYSGRSISNVGVRSNEEQKGKMMLTTCYTRFLRIPTILFLECIRVMITVP